MNRYEQPTAKAPEQKHQPVRLQHSFQVQSSAKEIADDYITCGWNLPECFMLFKNLA